MFSFPYDLSSGTMRTGTFLNVDVIIIDNRKGHPPKIQVVNKGGYHHGRESFKDYREARSGII